MSKFDQGWLDLEPPRSRKTDPETSREAAAKIKSGTIRAAILHQLDQSAGRGLTTYELSDKLGTRRDIVSPHLRPLARLGLVTEVGKRINHNSPSKNKCIVWNVTAFYYEKVHGTFRGTTIAPKKSYCPTCGQEV